MPRLPIPLLVTGKVRFARSFDLSMIVATLKRENISDRTIIIAGVAPLLISLLFHVDHLKPILSRIIVDRSKPFAGKLQNVRERQAHGAHSISVIYSIDYFKYANTCYIFISTSILREVKYKMFGTYFEEENKNVYMLTDKVCKYLYVFYVCILFEIL